MNGDPQYTNLPLLSTFLKYFSRAYLGPKPEGPHGKDEPLPEGMAELIPVEVQEKMRELFVGYFNGASKTLVKDQIVSISLPQIDIR